MIKYVTEQKKRCGLRVRQIRNVLGYTEKEFAKLTTLTENTIVNIEKGEGFNSNTITLLSFFTGMSLKELFDFGSPLPDSSVLKRNFLKNVKSHNSAGLEKMSNPRVTIKSILLEVARTSKYFNKPRKVSEVKVYLKEEYGSEVSSSVVSQALSNAYKDGHLKRTINGLRNYLYYS